MLCLYFCFWFVSHFKVCDIISTGTCFGNFNQDFPAQENGTGFCIFKCIKEVRNEIRENMWRCRDVDEEVLYHMH